MLDTLAMRTSEAVQAVLTQTTARIGAFALGAFLGFLVLVFVVRLDTYTIAGLSSIVAIIGGALVVGLLDKTLGGAAAVSAYLIGLFVGGAIYVALAVLGLIDLIFPPVVA